MKDIAERLLEHDGTVTSNRLAEEAALLRSAVEWLDVIEASAPELTSLIAKIRASGLPDSAPEERK